MDSYQSWFEKTGELHNRLYEKLKTQGYTKEEIIDYFSWENMVQKEKDFCVLFKENKKCHDIENLNCFFCGCPNFRITDQKERLKSFCGINSKKGSQFVHDEAIHQDCSSCTVPHNKNYIKKNFTTNWFVAMKEVNNRKNVNNKKENNNG